MTFSKRSESVDWVDKFRNASTRWGDAWQGTDARKRNKWHDRSVFALRHILASGGDSVAQVVNMKDSENCGTALLASTFALKFDARAAEAALQALALARTPLSFSAELVLREWRKGTLTFAWEDEA